MRVAIIVIIFSAFMLYHLLVYNNTKECEGFTIGAQGRYSLATIGEGRLVWVLDCQEGHLWYGAGWGVDKGVTYVGQAKIK